MVVIQVRHCCVRLIIRLPCHFRCFFFFNDTATTEIYTLSLHDALPIFISPVRIQRGQQRERRFFQVGQPLGRSEEHTSELQSQSNLVCRLLLEKKKTVTYSLWHILSRASRTTSCRLFTAYLR